MTVESEIREIEIDPGSKNPPDLNRIKTAWKDLKEDRTHANFPCFCPSCLYQAHKKVGGRFDKEAFFLDWLLFEIKLSLVNQTEKIVFKDTFDRGQIKIFVDSREFFKVRGSIKALSEFVEKNFSEINPDYQRINLRLWRFRKSGVLKMLEEKISMEWWNAHPVDFRKNESWKLLNLAQRIADFIYSRPEKSATQREICRRFFQKKSVEDLEDMRFWLKTNYGIGWKKRKKKNQIIYFGEMKNARGRFLRVGL